MEVKSREINKNSKIYIADRQNTEIDGVKKVESFNDQEIVLETTLGILILKGKDLHIKQLNLDEGNMAVEGYLKTLDYPEDGVGKKTGGLLSRMLR